MAYPIAVQNEPLFAKKIIFLLRTAQMYHDEDNPEIAQPRSMKDVVIPKPADAV
jgi:hypothetical protein